MSPELYIEAKITEKATGRCITVPADGTESEDALYFACLRIWISGIYPLRNSWIDILNRHLHTAYPYSETVIPVPQTALREMCSCLYSYCCTPEANRFSPDIMTCGFWDAATREQETGRAYTIPNAHTRNKIFWDMQNWEENYGSAADLLYDLIELLERIHYENRYISLKAWTGDGIGEREQIFPDDFITAPDDRRAFRENPQAYEWTFRLRFSAS